MRTMLTIGELSERSGIPASTLRYYDRVGLLHAERTAGNQRRYPRSALRRVSFVRLAQRVGVSLQEIAAALDGLPDSRTPDAADWAKLSLGWRERLDERIALLEGLRDRLSSCIGCGCLSLRSCALYNPDDALATEGPGPRNLLPPRERAENIWKTDGS